MPIQGPTRLDRMEYKWNNFGIIEKGPIDVVFEPGYFDHVAHLMKPNDRIEIVGADGSYEVHFRILSARKGAVRTRVLYLNEADAGERAAAKAEADQEDGLIVRWAGRAHKWRVEDSRTKNVLSHGHDTNEAALLERETIRAARRSV